MRQGIVVVVLWVAACGSPSRGVQEPRSESAPAPPPEPSPSPSPSPSPILTAATAPPPPAPPSLLPPVTTFQFTSTASTVIPGNSAAPQPPCSGTVGANDQLGHVAVLATYYQNGCYTDGGYNARDYPLEQGAVTAGATRFEAYRVSPPRTAAKQFVGSHHAVFYTFDAAVAQAVYSIEGGGVVALGRIEAAAITPGVPTRLPIDATALAGPLTFFVRPADERVSALALLATGVEGGRLASTALGQLDLYRYEVPGSPFDTRTAAPYASQHRHLFPVKLAAGLGIVWQDPTTHAISVTATDASPGAMTFPLANPTQVTLAAATSDGANTVFLVTVQDPVTPLATRDVRVIKLDLSTGAILDAHPDASQAGLNVTKFEEDDMASLAYANGTLGLMLARTMHRSPDGLNHQGGISVLFDATTLALISNLGQTSGHSFDNVLATEGIAFIGVDLGDNYPRGVNLHRFDGTSAATAHRDSAVLFTYKTQHGTTPASPAGAKYPPYPEISGKQAYYQWSNDNATYSELGGVVPDATGYTVVFANQSVNGHALDNSRAGGSWAATRDPQNIALVRVRHDFAAFANGSEVKDDLVLTKGPAETGGFFSFGGTWSKQRNTGVVWLTSFIDSSQNATRVRAVGTSDGNVLVLWEAWSQDRYLSTFGMLVDRMGKVITPTVELGASVRLSRRDDVLVDGKTIYIVGGLGPSHQLSVIALRRP